MKVYGVQKRLFHGEFGFSLSLSLHSV